MRKNRENYDTNRTMKRKPKVRGFWCMSCDACFIHAGQKCPVCGHRDKPGRNKKE